MSLFKVDSRNNQENPKKIEDCNQFEGASHILKQQGHLETLSFSCWNRMRNNIITVEVLDPDMS